MALTNRFHIAIALFLLTAATAAHSSDAIQAVVLDNSTKCIDTPQPLYCDGLSKLPGDTVTYFFEIRNDGTTDATNVVLNDNMSFHSEPPFNVPCIDLVSRVTVGALFCDPAPCEPLSTVSYNNPFVNGTFPLLLAGQVATFTATATVSPLAEGDCVNRWTLRELSPAVTNAPWFTVGGTTTTTCNLVAADLNTSSPRPTPPLRDAFANECQGVDDDLPGGRLVLPRASSGSTFDSPTPSSEELSFYQFDCCCSDPLRSEELGAAFVLLHRLDQRSHLALSRAR